MKAITLLTLITFSTATFAVEFVSKIQSVLPFGYYQGEYCSVSIGNGFSGAGVSLTIAKSLNNVYFTTTMSLYENSPWTEVLKDDSEFNSIDIKAKDNRGNTQRLTIKDDLVMIQLYEGRKVRNEVSCLVIDSIE